MKKEKNMTTKTVFKIMVPKEISNSFVSVSVIDECNERYVIVEDPDDDSWMFPITSKSDWKQISLAINAALQLCK
jgi:hypothetical protein